VPPPGYAGAGVLGVLCAGGAGVLGVLCAGGAGVLGVSCAGGAGVLGSSLLGAVVPAGSSPCSRQRATQDVGATRTARRRPHDGQWRGGSNGVVHLPPVGHSVETWPQPVQ
jgi:hypothetical protein